MRTVSCCTALLLLLAILPRDGFAQTSDTTRTAELEEIEVIGTRALISEATAPLSLSLRDRSLRILNGDASLSISSVTGQIPGIWVSDRENYALGERITIRGLGWRAAFGVRGIQVLLDGIPLTVADGQSMIDIIDPAFIRRTEVIRGPASAFWGNSSGGVLHLSTAPEPRSGERFRARMTGGSYGLLKTEAQYRSAGTHSLNVFSSWVTDPGFRNYSSARLWRSGVTGSADLKQGRRLTWMGALAHMPFAEHPSGLTREQAEENPRMAVDTFENSEAGKTITQMQAGVGYRDSGTPVGAVGVTAYGIHRDLVNPLPFGIIDIGRLAGGLRVTADNHIGDLELRGGAEIKIQHDDRTEFDNDAGERGAVQVDQTETVFNQALFTTASWSAGSFQLLGGLRYDRLAFSADPAEGNGGSGDRLFQALSPSLGISWNRGITHLFANFSTGFEAPTTTELVNRPDGQQGFNPEIGPEQTTGWEAGIRGFSSELPVEYELTLYLMRIGDLLFPYQLEADGPVFYRNQGETEHRGIEARFGLDLSSALSLQSAYTLTDARFLQAETLDGTSLDANRVPGVPKHRVNTVLAWRGGPADISLHHEWVSRYPADNLNTAWNHRYGVIDLKAGYRHLFAGGGSAVQPFVNLNNILDKRYNGSVVVNAFGGRYYEPAPGRNWQFGVSVEF